MFTRLLDMIFIICAISASTGHGRDCFACGSAGTPLCDAEGETTHINTCDTGSCYSIYIASVNGVKYGKGCSELCRDISKQEADSRTLLRCCTADLCNIGSRESLKASLSQSGAEARTSALITNFRPTLRTVRPSRMAWEKTTSISRIWSTLSKRNRISSLVTSFIMHSPTRTGTNTRSSTATSARRETATRPPAPTSTRPRTNVSSTANAAIEGSTTLKSNSATRATQTSTKANSTASSNNVITSISSTTALTKLTTAAPPVGVLLCYMCGTPGVFLCPSLLTGTPITECKGQCYSLETTNGTEIKWERGCADYDCENSNSVSGKFRNARNCCNDNLCNTGSIGLIHGTNGLGLEIIFNAGSALLVSQYASIFCIWIFLFVFFQS